VRRLTEMMGGTVSATSEPERGSCFQLHFPDVAVSETAPAVDPVRVIKATDFNRLRPATLLAVDDNQMNCELMEAMFEGSHHRLLIANGGREGLEAAVRERPDVILLDVRMPHMDGRQTLQAIREIADLNKTPVIAMTASSLVEEEHEIRAQFSGYLRKPFSQHDVFEELKNFLPVISQSTDASALPPDDVTENVAPTPLPVEALAEVDRLIDIEWPPVRDSVAINQSKDFASKVDGLGQRWHCQPLIAYARTLRRHADSYAVADLESTLLQFSSLAVELRKQAKHEHSN
jgi:CheY-like chemotaxis protein